MYKLFINFEYAFKKLKEMKINNRLIGKIYMYQKSKIIWTSIIIGKRKIRKITTGHKGRSVYHSRAEENNKELSPEKWRTWVKNFILCACVQC